ncbi:hypothetical protein D7322_15760 [Sphingobacterium puteale]|uniref:RcnB family protein n=1 Tax=Sphingobacterium puteale TaxID=2420510 RepID=A0A420VWJ5_9SPHI|nr:hypothetical protein [Sphingobacterium puteale]RKO70724.1 hypothetical protein D7322_15760 [Sphingobacterium puteale]
MKKILYFALAIGGLALITPKESSAQHRGNDREWKHEKEHRKYEEKRDKEERKYWEKREKEERKHYKKVAKYYRKEYRHGPPAWARAHRYDNRHHVYFRDYKTFYDPYRNGYVYMRNGKWSFSASVPSFMLNVNLGAANIRVVKDVPISRHPEDFYDDYRWD